VVVSGGIRRQKTERLISLCVSPFMKKDTWKKIELIETEFRHAENSFMAPIALKLRGRWLEVVEPVLSESDSPLAPLLGQTERGKLYYLGGDMDVLLYLVEERGMRNVNMTTCKLTAEQCKLIREAAHQAWVVEKMPLRYVEKLLESLDLTVIKGRT
jgi:hypothetical protein